MKNVLAPIQYTNVRRTAARTDASVRPVDFLNSPNLLRHSGVGVTALASDEAARRKQPRKRGKEEETVEVKHQVPMTVRTDRRRRG